MTKRIWNTRRKRSKRHRKNKKKRTIMTVELSDRGARIARNTLMRSNWNWQWQLHKMMKNEIKILRRHSNIKCKRWQKKEGQMNVTGAKLRPKVRAKIPDPVIKDWSQTSQNVTKRFSKPNVVWASLRINKLKTKSMNQPRSQFSGMSCWKTNSIKW